MALGDNLSGDQRNAYEAVNNLFSSYGLGSLAPKIYSYIQNGYSADTTSILLQQTPEYQQRFAGNQIRQAKGLPVLSPAQYLQNEQNYRQVMSEAGLPRGFYDQASDFNQFIGDDISPSELKSRVDEASKASITASPELKQALQKMYGIDQSGITAYFLDEQRALPHLQQQAAAAQIGAEALKNGLQISPYSEQYAQAGVTANQAAQAYGRIATNLPTYSRIAALSGETVTQGEYEQALLGNVGQQSEQAQGKGGEFIPNETPEAKIARLESWNRARSEGKVGAASGLLGLSMTQTQT